MDSEGHAPDLSVIVPVFGNADTLEVLTERLRAAIRTLGLSAELIFVNDGSEDDSLQVLERLFEKHREIGVLDLDRNLGQHRAVLAGLAESRGEWCLVMDADLQDPPEELAALWRARNESVDVVFGGRRGNYESPLRLLTGWSYRVLISRCARLPVDAGMFMLARRTMIENVVRMADGDIFLPVMLACAGARCISIPIRRDRCPAGKVSGYSWRKRMDAARTAFRCARRYCRGQVIQKDPEAAEPSMIRKRYRHSA